MKFLVVLLAVVVLLWLLFGRSRLSRRESRSGGQGAGTPPAVSEGMVACAHCGLHVPASEALQHGGLHYCGAAHRDAGPRPPDR